MDPIILVVGTKQGNKKRNASGLIFIFGTAVYENLTIFNFLHPPAYTVSRSAWHQLRLPLSPPRCFPPCCSESHQSDLSAICCARPFSRISSVKQEQRQIDFNVSRRREKSRVSSSAGMLCKSFCSFRGELKKKKKRLWLAVLEKLTEHKKRFP